MIDVNAHILPPKFMAAVQKKTPIKPYPGRFGLMPMPPMHDIEARIRLMDQFEGYTQILTMNLPPVEDVADPKTSLELAQIANDEMAELVMKYPDKFLAATACLPLNDMDAAMKELDRAINELRFRGVQITSTILDKPLYSPEFEPLFEKMHTYDLPILIHPRTMQSGPRAFDIFGIVKAPPFDDVRGEADYWAQSPFIWPYETTLAMGHIGISGLLDKYPNLKIITHHCGGVTPYQAHRTDAFTDLVEMRFKAFKTYRTATKRLGDYYKMFYADTALYGNTSALKCGLEFFGNEKVLFATDFPWDSQGGFRYVRDTIRSVEALDISEEETEKIFSGNARKIFRLPV